MNVFDLFVALKMNKDGYDKGLKDGIEQGFEQGKIQIAKNLIAQNIDLEIIANVTGLSVEQIKKL